jgi:hypothetical protein
MAATALAERLVADLRVDVRLLAPRQQVEHAGRQLDRHAGAVLDLLQRARQRRLELDVNGLVERLVDQRGAVALGSAAGAVSR